MEIDISVVIPCLNEKETIAEVIIAAARELDKSNFRYEIIVVDNGSTDGSDAIAKNLNTTVLSSSSKTVAGVRNMGADLAKGKLLVFLDADVVVQSNWGQTLQEIYQDMIRPDNTITGSHCSVPGNIKPLLSSWYKGISTDTRDTHLGAGHMVVSIGTFKNLGGFNADLVTGEDYDFCYRAKKMGVAVVSNLRLVACHLGYPTNLWGFARREIWHGEGDCGSLKSILSSSVALCGVIFLLINIFIILSLFINFKIFLVLLSILTVMTIFINYYKFGFGGFRDFFYRNIISYVYLLSRGLSLPFSILRK